VFPIVKEMGFDETFERGWFWDAELLIRAQKKGLRIAELPIRWKEGEMSSFDFSRELRCLKWMWRAKKKLNKIDQENGSFKQFH
jgi:hypothetical protein